MTSRTTTPTVELDAPYSSPDAAATDWHRTNSVLADAAIYWLSTVRGDGRPHVTPVIAVWTGGAVHVCTGPDEQKAKNLIGNSNVVLMTGTNLWSGIDVVVEGEAVRVTDDSQFARPRRRVGGEIRRGVALRRRQRRVPSRRRRRPRVRHHAEQGLCVRPRRAGRRHPIPLLNARESPAPRRSASAVSWPANALRRRRPAVTPCRAAPPAVALRHRMTRQNDASAVVRYRARTAPTCGCPCPMVSSRSRSRSQHLRR